MEPVSRASYEKMPTPNKLDVLFDISMELHKCICDTQFKLETLEEKVDNRRKLDASLAGMFGIFGGFIAVITGKFLK